MPRYRDVAAAVTLANFAKVSAFRTQFFLETDSSPVNERFLLKYRVPNHLAQIVILQFLIQILQYFAQIPGK